MRIIALAFTALFLHACQSDGAISALEPDDNAKAALIEAECLIYFAVEARLASENRQSNGNLSEGCAPSTSVISADIAPHEPPRQIDSQYAKTLYQRMIARGMPKDIADDVSKSNAFFDLVQDTDTVYFRR